MRKMLLSFHEVLKKEILFVLEVLVNRTFGNTCPAGYLGNARIVEIAPAEYLYGCLKDLLPSRGLLVHVLQVLNHIQNHMESILPKVYMLIMT